jgi:acetyl-CoA carboxylase biotin carboxyl carrier protein
LSLTAKDVAEIMRLLEESSFDSLSLEIDGMKLNLQRNSAKAVRSNSPSAEALVRTQSSGPLRPAHKEIAASQPGLIEVTAPLLGIFYRAPRPGEPPFVEVGSKVQQDTVIAIIEVMKLMNSVPAGVKGEVVEILAENGAAVEYGEILLRVRPEP